MVVLDQFEELFLRVGSRQRAVFFTELANCLAAPEREVRFVFCLREDYLARLDEARPSLPDILGNSFRLATLERRNARVAITEPAERAGLMVEPVLVDALVGGEGWAGGPGDLVEKDGHVPPAALQIIMDRLYRAALPPDYAPEGPPPPALALTLAGYRAIRYCPGAAEGTEELRGAAAILAGYVDEGLKHVPQPELAQAILKVMVTSQATKAALTQAEMIDLLDEAGLIRAGDPADQSLVEQTRLSLERVRLLRGFERNGQALYELAHDHLAAEVARRLDAAELGAKLARELLRRELDNWRGAKLLIRPEVLPLIHERRVELKWLKCEELELIFRTALMAGYEVPYWFTRAQAGGVPVDEIILVGLREANFRTRVLVVSRLAQLGEHFAKDIMGMLSDDYPQVRLAAIQSLEQMALDVAWRQHLVYECFVPAGPFIMGDDNGNKDEKPAHEVFVKALYIGKYPVTNADYKRYMDDTSRPFDIPQGKADHPVVSVSWYDARDYAAWAGMRLLTEVEWEKVASWVGEQESREEGVEERIDPFFKRDEKRQLGRKRKYPWGNEFDKNRCNTNEAGIKDTTSVGKYSPAGDSPYGCADMTGNVWEWTSSLYRAYPYQANDGREDSGGLNRRVLRGGAFDGYSLNAPVTSRSHSGPYVHSWRFGLRVGAAAPFSSLTSENSDL